MPSTTKAEVRVFIVAESMLRWGLGQLVGGDRRFELAGEADSLAAAVTLATADIDVLLLDIDSDPIQRFLHSHLDLMRQLPVLALSSVDSDALDWALVNGLRGIVRKSEEPAMILKAIVKVHEGEIWVSRATVKRMFAQLWDHVAPPISEADRARLATLTLRETETVIALTSDSAAPCKVVADRLKISEHTLRNHLTSIYAKLDVRGRVDLYAFAAKCNTQRRRNDTPRVRSGNPKLPFDPSIEQIEPGTGLRN